MYHVVCLFTLQLTLVLCQLMLVLIVPTHRGMAQAELIWVPVLCQSGLPILKRSPTRIYPAWHRPTALIETNALPTDTGSKTVIN